MGENVQERYLQIAVETATPGQLITLLLDGALRFLKQARQCFQRGDLAGVNSNLLRAQAVVEELNNDLDLERGGEIAANLRKLYLFINERLLAANVQKSPTALEEAFRLLTELRSGWAEGVRLMSGKTATPVAPPRMGSMQASVDLAVE